MASETSFVSHTNDYQKKNEVQECLKKVLELAQKPDINFSTLLFGENPNHSQKLTVKDLAQIFADKL
jgi:hypothetical protein